MHVSEINIYPIKSTRGIPLESAKVRFCGIENDRRWMVVDETGRFVSQREAPRLALVSTVITGETITMSAPGRRNLVLPKTLTGRDRVRGQVWDDSVDVIQASDEASRWMSEYVGAPCRLVYLPEESRRPVDSAYGSPTDHVSLADGFPLLIISQASLDDLNSRLKYPVPMNRFRPSLVVEGSRPFEEDQWKKIVVGTLELRVVKPCSRCVTTTVDQATGRKGVEPLATLAQYRKVGGNVHFGQNAIPDNEAVIKLRDKIKVIQ